MSQYNDSGCSRCSKWPNDRTVAVVKHCWAPRTTKKRLQRKMTKDYCWIGDQENIDMFSKLLSDRNNLIWLPLFKKTS